MALDENTDTTIRSRKAPEGSDEAFIRNLSDDLSGKRRDEAQRIANEIIEHAYEWPVVAGVYFLIDGNEIVYVGRSKNLHKRVGEHVQGDIEFDRVATFEIPDDDYRRWMERNYLEWLHPEHNSRWRP